MFAMKTIIWVLFLCLALDNLSEAFVCTKDFCANRVCEPITDCGGPNQGLRPGVCGCCQQCVTLLGNVLYLLLFTTKKKK